MSELSVIGIIARRTALTQEIVDKLAQRFEVLIDDERQRTENNVALITTPAEGPSNIFIEVALSYMLPMALVIPYAGYIEEFEEGESRNYYKHLLGRAKKVLTQPFSEPGFRAERAAFRAIIDACTLPVFIWNGKDINELAEAFRYAGAQNKPAILIDPESAEDVVK